MHGRHGFSPRTGDEQPIGQFTPSGKFGRMFPHLRPLIPPIEHLDELGAAMLDTPGDDPNGDNTNVPAGYTYLGQFIDHDITFDPTALQEIIVDPLALRNFRTPMLDLDCLYGSGPGAQPYLYRRDDSELFLIGNTSSTPGGGDSSVPTGLPFDLPRATHGFATIGDPRNDENLVVAQLHLAFLRFHNKVVADIRSGKIKQDSPIRKSPFEEARDTVIWHYQWIVLMDFLRRILDLEQLDLVIDEGRKFYNPVGDPFIPVEFSVAAYRFGHTMVRNVYDYNRVFTPNPGGRFPAGLDLLFRFSGLSGDGSGTPIPSDWIIDWRRFFEVGSGATVGFTRKMNPLLVQFLQNLPGVPPPKSLAARNLRRGRSLALPPGQSVARAMGFTPLTPAQISKGPDGAVAAKHGFHLESPLWYYILKEAEVQGGGKRLGKVGSRIIAEVFVGLLEADTSSWLSRRPQWKPTLPAKKKGTFTIADMLEYVGDLNPIG